MTAVYAAVVTLLSQKRHGQIFEGVADVASSSLSLALGDVKIWPREL
jgi:hypothetical protein